MGQLSPLTAASMRHLREFHGTATKPVDARKEAIEVHAYECPICSMLYRDDDQAKACCQGSGTFDLHSEEGPAICPVCGDDHRDNWLAADCCLWHEFDGPTRWRIAAAVEAGAEWADQIQLETSKKE